MKAVAHNKAQAKAHAKARAAAQATPSPSGEHKLVTVTLMRSVHGQLKHIAASVRGLGLRRRHQSVMIADTAANRGMINSASHMLKVESN
jgi:large subunit ribosomal protein L30